MRLPRKERRRKRRKPRRKKKSCSMPPNPQWGKSDAKNKIQRGTLYPHINPHPFQMLALRGKLIHRKCRNSCIFSDENVPPCILSPTLSSSRKFLQIVFHINFRVRQNEDEERPKTKYVPPRLRSRQKTLQRNKTRPASSRYGFVMPEVTTKKKVDVKVRRNINHNPTTISSHFSPQPNF